MTVQLAIMVSAMAAFLIAGIIGIVKNNLRA